MNGAVSGSEDTNLATDAAVPVEMSPAMTKLSGYLTYISSSTVLHGDTLPTACIVLTIFSLLLLVPAFYFTRYSAPSKQERYAALALVLGLFVAAVVWYPGYFAVKKGMRPWPYPGSEVSAGSDGKAICVDGRAHGEGLSCETRWSGSRRHPASPRKTMPWRAPILAPTHTTT